MLSWVSAGLAALYGFGFVKSFATNYIRNDLLATIASGTVIFFIFLIFLSIVTHFLSRFVKESVLGGVDRALGGFFGLIRGIVVLAVLNLAVTTLLANYTHMPLFTSSKLLPPIHRVSDWMLQALPKKYKEKVTTFQEQAKTSVIDPLGENSLKKESMDQTAASLARLMPKYEAPKNIKNPDGYDRKSQSVMERLLQTHTNDQGSQDLEKQSLDQKVKEAAHHDGALHPKKSQIHEGEESTNPLDRLIQEK
jgi:membrane protein required for colicin V production